jgi:hypothetical protein
MVRETIIVYSKNHTKRINKLCGKIQSGKYSDHCGLKGQIFSESWPLYDFVVGLTARPSVLWLLELRVTHLFNMALRISVFFFCSWITSLEHRNINALARRLMILIEFGLLALQLYAK